MMLLLVSLLIQDTSPRIILSDDPTPPIVALVERPKPNLPARATADPYGWERSQCSPYIRQNESLEACQFRIRSELQAVMGETLPEGLKPAPKLENCAPGDATNAYQVSCQPRAMTMPDRPNLQDRVCHNQPQRQPNGTVSVQSVCRPETDPAPREARSLTLFSTSQ